MSVTSQFHQLRPFLSVRLLAALACNRVHRRIGVKNLSSEDFSGRSNVDCRDDALLTGTVFREKNAPARDLVMR